jgi:ferrous-iron efflux pump FieF
VASESLAPEGRARLLRQATVASVATALLLALGKTASWAATGSVALLASLVDSLMDVGASLLTALAVRYALKPADDEHRFGHGKSEALAALAQALIIIGSAVFLVVYAIDRFLTPRPLASLPIGIGMMVVSIAATGGLVAFQRSVVRRTGSAAIRADALHYVADLSTNAATIVALGLSGLGWTRVDPVFAIAIALVIGAGAWKIGRDAFEVLMDRELPNETQERIRAIALANQRVRGVHDMRTRRSGHTLVIELHLEMDGRISLTDAHAIGVDVEAAIDEAFPNADVIIHADPSGIDEPRRFD